MNGLDWSLFATGLGVVVVCECDSKPRQTSLGWCGGKPHMHTVWGCDFIDMDQDLRHGRPRSRGLERRKIYVDSPSTLA